MSHLSASRRRNYTMKADKWRQQKQPKYSRRKGSRLSVRRFECSPRLILHESALTARNNALTISFTASDFDRHCSFFFLWSHRPASVSPEQTLSHPSHGKQPFVRNWRHSAVLDWWLGKLSSLPFLQLWSARRASSQCRSNLRYYNDNCYGEIAKTYDIVVALAVALCPKLLMCVLVCILRLFFKQCQVKVRALSNTFRWNIREALSIWAQTYHFVLLACGLIGFCQYTDPYASKQR